MSMTAVYEVNAFSRKGGQTGAGYCEVIHLYEYMEMEMEMEEKF